MEKEPIFTTKEEEVEWLRNRLREITETIEGEKETMEKKREFLREHAAAEQRISEAYKKPPYEIKSKVEELKKEPHHQKQIDALLQYAEDHGVWNAAQVAKGLNNDHLLDDFHDQLIAKKLWGIKIR